MAAARCKRSKTAFLLGVVMGRVWRAEEAFLPEERLDQDRIFSMSSILYRLSKACNTSGVRASRGPRHPEALPRQPEPLPEQTVLSVSLSLLLFFLYDYHHHACRACRADGAEIGIYIFQPHIGCFDDQIMSGIHVRVEKLFSLCLPVCWPGSPCFCDDSASDCQDCLRWWRCTGNLARIPGCQAADQGGRSQLLSHHSSSLSL